MGNLLVIIVKDAEKSLSDNEAFVFTVITSERILYSKINGKIMPIIFQHLHFWNFIDDNDYGNIVLRFIQLYLLD